MNTNQNTKLTLVKAKNSLDSANNLLSKINRSNQVDECWIERLWKWADKNAITDYEVVNYPQYNKKEVQGLPRNKEELLSMNVFIINGSFKVDMIPKEIGMLKNLQQIGIYNTNINTLPKEIGNLKNLTYLGLSGNKLEEIPKEIGNLENLTHFFLSDNKLKELPKEIGQLKKLTHLNLDNNKLNKIPEEIGNLTNLIDLDFGTFLSGRNFLSELPRNIINLKKLNRLMIWSELELKITKEQLEWIQTLHKKGCTVGHLDNYE